MYNDNDNNNNLILIVYLFLQNRYTEHILRKEKFSYWWCPRTLTGIALDWFSGLRDGPITSFEEFSRQFVAQLAANKQSPPSKTDLFDVRQQQRESLKVTFLNMLLSRNFHSFCFVMDLCDELFFFSFSCQN